MKKVKYILTVAVFALILFGLAVGQILLPDQDKSYTERRELARAPEVTAKAVFNREFSDKLETYLLDQFPLRERFRQLNAAFRFYGLRQLDSNGIFIKDGMVFKTETTTNEDQIRYGAAFYTALIDGYLKDCNVYYTVVPDKGWFVRDLDYPHLDYDLLYDIMKNEVKGAEFIDIRDTLALDRYYRTDTHWKQPDLFDTVQKIGDAMGVGEALTPESAYTPHTLSPFNGVYMQQSAVPMEGDDLVYLTSEYTESAAVSGPMYKYDTVYVPKLFEGMDGYDVFLGGSQPIIEIECPNAKTDRELYIFRDSFGSSLAPLFTGAYSRITVIDLRYVTTAYLPTYVTFTPGADVLLINSTLVLNTAMIMR